MRFLPLLSVCVSIAHCASIAARDDLNATEVTVADDAGPYDDLIGAYDPDDPVIAGFPKMDPSEVFSYDYTDEMIAEDYGLSDNTTLDIETASKAIVEKRDEMYKHFCHLTNYQNVQWGPMLNGIFYLGSKGNTIFCCGGKKCCRPSCSYGQGINVCNGMHKEKCYVLGSLGAHFRGLWHRHCNRSLICTWLQKPFCSTRAPALQGFFHNSNGFFNMIGRGGFDC